MKKTKRRWQEDDVMRIITIVNMLINAPFEEMSVVTLKTINNSLITLMITVILGSCFFLIDWLSFSYSETERERVRFKLNVEGQEGERILDVDGQGGWEVLKIGQILWTSYVYYLLVFSFWVLEKGKWWEWWQQFWNIASFLRRYCSRVSLDCTRPT